MKKIFEATPSVMVKLLANDKKIFADTFADYYFLNSLSMQVFLRIFNTLEEFSPLFEKVSIEENEVKAVIKLFQERFGRTDVNIFLANIDRFDLLVQADNCSEFIEQDAYLSQICEKRTELGISNTDLYEKGYKDLLEKAEDWKTFIENDDADMLAKHELFSHLIQGGINCYNALATVPTCKVVSLLQQIEDPNYNRDVSYFVGYLIKKENFSWLANGDGWKLLCNELISDKILPLLRIAKLNDYHIEINTDLWQLLLKEMNGKMRSVLMKIDNKEAVALWIYTIANKLSNFEIQQEIKACFPWYSKMQYRLGSKKWQGKLADIEKKLK